MIRTLLIVVLLSAPGTAQAECRLAIALALDVSGSVDSRDYALQRNGLAGALRDPRVVQAILARPETPVDLMVYEWSDQGSTRTILPWQAMTSANALESATTRIETAPRAAMPPATALGDAMRHGIRSLASRRCWQRTLDISGDGRSNTGPRPGPLRAVAQTNDITINALVIGHPDPSETTRLTAYFRANVITGPGAFTETARDFSNYKAAMTRKLLRELTQQAISMR
ncbi:DUF1194 domain-containing protein [Alisedimentitalea sp. MJ-SS2]|uniref:DUF1194 domain-containing protein n=1 Tax=Aliisedimentitalea sp. MJ-SS2 TaxID=3049795 RepID=UPI002913D334|nr:DUF1194 domain-containing protein [Alisedimentitalea sp. MJ-SS2]MDU8926338.1 DUF1194 domain-containing protein [Alisedimentitalea sp. MJ-SS2]